MDKDEKIKMLLDMQEHPGQFSEQTLEQMLNDAEARELMEATAQLKRAMKNDEFTMSEQDVENEWQDFTAAHLAGQEYNHSEAKQSINLWSLVVKGIKESRVAATFIGILFFTGIAFAAIRILTHTSNPSPKVEQKEYIQVRDTIVKENTPISPTREAEGGAVTFDNVTLDSIARDIAAYHHMEIDLQNEQARNLRFYFVWKRDDSLEEVIEKLNMFERVNMAMENGKLIVR